LTTPAPVQTVANTPTPVASSISDAVIVDHLSKTYSNGTKAVQDVSFRVKRGEIFGILGPNGAGKSTTIGILGTLVVPTGGRALVNGIDVARHRDAVRKIIGFAMQDAGVDDLATGREFLLLQGRLYGLPKETIERRAGQLFQLFELADAADKRIKAYSGGMKRRIDLASALIHFPKILFLDEPTEGLDPRSRITMWNTLKRLRKQLGTTILLSTHYMEEADRLCDRIAIIDKGRIVTIGTAESLKASVGGQSVVLEYASLDQLKVEAAQRAVEKTGLATRIQRTGSTLNCYVKNGAEAAPKLLRALDQAKAAPASLRVQQPTLDDVYLKYTGRKIEEAESKPAEGGAKQ
jgi:ABC-2 type transport system ATP-binding protein